MWRLAGLALFTCSACAGLHGPAGARSAQPSLPPAAQAPRPAAGADLLRGLPLRFETTGGAEDADAVARGRGYSLILDGGSATVALEGQRRHRVRMTLAGGSAGPTPTPLGPQRGVTRLRCRGARRRSMSQAAGARHER